MLERKRPELGRLRDGSWARTEQYTCIMVSNPTEINSFRCVVAEVAETHMAVRRLSTHSGVARTQEYPRCWETHSHVSDAEKTRTLVFLPYHRWLVRAIRAQNTGNSRGYTSAERCGVDWNGTSSG